MRFLENRLCSCNENHDKTLTLEQAGKGGALRWPGRGGSALGVPRAPAGSREVLGAAGFPPPSRVNGCAAATAEPPASPRPPATAGPHLIGWRPPGAARCRRPSPGPTPAPKGRAVGQRRGRQGAAVLAEGGCRFPPRAVPLRPPL